MKDLFDKIKKALSNVKELDSVENNKHHKIKITIYDETNDEYLFNDYIKGGIVTLIPVNKIKGTGDIYTMAYTECKTGELLAMLNTSNDISEELTDKVLKNTIAKILKGDEDNE